MAPSRKSKPAFEFKGFVECELSKDELTALKKQEFSYEEGENQLIRLSEAGFKISFKYDGYNQCQQVTMMSDDPKSENAGWILVARGSTPFKALKQLCYKHYEVLGELWGSAATARSFIDD